MAIDFLGLTSIPDPQCETKTSENNSEEQQRKMVTGKSDSNALLLLVTIQQLGHLQLMESTLQASCPFNCQFCLSILTGCLAPGVAKFAAALASARFIRRPLYGMSPPMTLMDKLPYHRR